jgi:hypothetical protein
MHPAMLTSSLKVVTIAETAGREGRVGVGADMARKVII